MTDRTLPLPCRVAFSGEEFCIVTACRSFCAPVCFLLGTSLGAPRFLENLGTTLCGKDPDTGCVCVSTYFRSFFTACRLFCCSSFLPSLTVPADSSSLPRSFPNFCSFSSSSPLSFLVLFSVPPLSLNGTCYIGQAAASASTTVTVSQHEDEHAASTCHCTCHCTCHNRCNILPQCSHHQRR